MAETNLDRYVKRLDVLSDVIYLKLSQKGRISNLDMRSFLSAAASVVSEYYEEKERKGEKVSQGDSDSGVHVGT